MRNSLPLTLLAIVVVAGVFPAQAHALVNLSADLVAAVYSLLQGQGVSISQRSVQTGITIIVVVIAFGALSAAIGGGKLFKWR